MCYAKTILYAYPYLSDACLNLEAKINRKCSLSFYSETPCFDFCEKILKLMGDKQLLYDLKQKVRLILSRLSVEEKLLLSYKYFKKRPIDGFDYKSRKYFRKQLKVLQKFKELLSFVGISEDIFMKEYANISFIKSIMIRLEDLSCKD